MIETTLIQALFVALWIIGVYEVTQDGEPLHFIRAMLDKVGLNQYGSPKTWYKPVLGCAKCMSSVHSLLWWFVFPMPLVYLALQILTTYGIVRFIRNQWYEA